MPRLLRDYGYKAHAKRLVFTDVGYTYDDILSRVFDMEIYHMSEPTQGKTLYHAYVMDRVTGVIGYGLTAISLEASVQSAIGNLFIVQRKKTLERLRKGGKIDTRSSGSRLHAVIVISLAYIALLISCIRVFAH